MYTSADNAIPR